MFSPAVGQVSDVGVLDMCTGRDTRRPGPKTEVAKRAGVDQKFNSWAGQKYFSLIQYYRVHISISLVSLWLSLQQSASPEYRGWA